MKIVRADLHNHLRTRSDMRGLFNPTIDAARARLGIGGIVGLVNFADRRYEDFSQERGYEKQDLGNALYVPEKDILVVKGQEVPTKEGHLLVLGLRKDVHLKDNRTLTDTLKEANDNNGIIIADHPFYLNGIGQKLKIAPDHLDYLDGIEVHNGEAALSLFGIFPKDANRRAQEYFAGVGSIRKNLGAIASSDSHSLRELGTSWTKISMPCNYELSLTSPEEVVDNLRTGIIENRLKKLKMQMHNSRFDAFAHAASLAAIVGLQKLGIEI